MGKKRFNAKGRQKVQTIIDDSETKRIRIELQNDETIDNANQLVLPSKKRATKIKSDQVTVTRILSKKQRKRLEKIVDQKRKKENRTQLIEALASVQIKPSELAKYSSISSIQTKGLRKLKKSGAEITEKRLDDNGGGGADGGPILSVGSKRKRLDLLAPAEEPNEKKPRDYNVVGLDESSGSCSEDELPDAAPMPPKEPETPIVVPKAVVTAPPPVAEPKKPIIDRKPAVYIHVDRDAKIQAARLKLPILAEEQIIMETISDNAVTIIAGETGSGKTTQVPQFLYEAGYAENKMIGVTEPRRVAAISMSRRIAEEMNLGSDIVSYLMRFEGNVTPETKIKFMTDGVLLKEAEEDIMLSRYSVIILDEAHERSVYTDILVGLLSRIVLARCRDGSPLKLIIMSATLRVEDFTGNEKLFKTPPPVLKVESRQYPVTIHFNKTTAENYTKEAYNKTIKIHTKLPEGGILVFLTGQKEVKYLVDKLRKAFPYDAKHLRVAKTDQSGSPSEDDGWDEEDWDMVRYRKKKRRNRAKKGQKQIQMPPKISLDNYKIAGIDNDSDPEEKSSSSDSEFEALDEMSKTFARGQPLWVLPLYSALSSEKQSEVFKPIPSGARLCVVATNVAETSITIPNIKYVIDSGRQKTKIYDKVTGVSTFRVTFTSKASANQRAGRAGRIGPGHCYRLYSSAVYNDEFEQYSPPEIQQKPIDDLVLQMKSMGIDHVVNFPFPSPPAEEQMETAERRLKLLGALEEAQLADGGGTLSRITRLGRLIASFAVSPRFGKMLALTPESLLPYAIAMVAALSVPMVLEEPESSEVKKAVASKRKFAGKGESLLLGDPSVLLRFVGAAQQPQMQEALADFCGQHGVRIKALKEIMKIRQQLTNQSNLALPGLNICIPPELEPPSDEQMRLLREIVTAGMIDQVARRMNPTEARQYAKNHNEWGIEQLKHAYLSPEITEPVFLHQTCVLKDAAPEWIVYQEVFETESNGRRKIFLRGVTAIEPAWLLKYGLSLCRIKRHLDDPPPRFEQVSGSVRCYVEAVFGRLEWPLPLTEMEAPRTMDAYRLFGRFLLSGDVCAKLAPFKAYLVATPDAMIKKWSKMMQRTQALASRLAQACICTRKDLLKAWKEDKEFLLREYQMWLPESRHHEVQSIWPPTD